MQIQSVGGRLVGIGDQVGVFIVVVKSLGYIGIMGSELNDK